MTFFIINLLLSIIVGLLSTPLYGVLTFVGLYFLLFFWVTVFVALAAYIIAKAK